MKINYILIIAFLFLNKLGRAQQDTLTKKHTYFFDAGVGFGKGSEDGMFVQAYVQVRHKANYLSIRTSGFEKIDLFGDEPQPAVAEYSLLFGKNYVINKNSNLQFGIGIGVAEITSRGKFLYNTCKGMFCVVGHNVYEKITQNPIAIPLEIKYNLFFTRKVGLNLGLNMNINKVQTFFAVNAGFLVGRLKDK